MVDENSKVFKEWVIRITKKGVSLMPKNLHIPSYRERGSGSTTGSVIIVSIVLTFVAGLVFGSASFGGLTGYDTFTNFPTVRETQQTHPNLIRNTGPTSIVIEPSNVRAGSPIYIDVEPGPQGVRADMKIRYFKCLSL